MALGHLIAFLFTFLVSTAYCQDARRVEDVDQVVVKGENISLSCPRPNRLSASTYSWAILQDARSIYYPRALQTPDIVVSSWLLPFGTLNFECTVADGGNNIIIVYKSFIRVDSHATVAYVRNIVESGGTVKRRCSNGDRSCLVTSLQFYFSCVFLCSSKEQAAESALEHYSSHRNVDSSPAIWTPNVTSMGLQTCVGEEFIKPMRSRVFHKSMPNYTLDRECETIVYGAHHSLCESHIDLEELLLYDIEACNNSIESSPLCNKIVDDLYISCDLSPPASGVNMAAYRIHYGPKFQVHAANVNVKGNSLITMLSPAFVILPDTTPYAFFWETTRGGQVAVGANRKHTFDTSLAHSDVVILVCKVYLLTDPAQADYYTININVEIDSLPLVFAWVIPISVVICLITIPGSLIVRHFYKNLSIYDEYGMSMFWFKLCPRRNVFKNNPNIAFLPLVTDRNVVKVGEDCKKLRTDLLKGTKLTVALGKPANIIKKQLKQDIAGDDEDAEWLRDALNKCERWKMELEEESYDESSSAIMNYDSIEPLLSDYPDKFNKYRGITTKTPSIHDYKDWIRKHRPKENIAGSLKSLGKTVAVSTMKKTAGLTFTTSGHTWESSMFSGISYDEIMQMANSIVDIYEKLAGGRGSLLTKRNVEHIFSDYSNHPVYIANYKPQVDAILDRIFSVANDTAEYKTLHEAIMSCIRQTAGGSKEKKLVRKQPSTKFKQMDKSMAVLLKLSKTNKKKRKKAK